MTGYDLRLWRTGMNWEQERAAEELGVSLRTYWSWEKTGPGDKSKLVALATMALSLKAAWPEATKSLKQIATIIKH